MQGQVHGLFTACRNGIRRLAKRTLPAGNRKAHGSNPHLGKNMADKPFAPVGSSQSMSVSASSGSTNITVEASCPSVRFYNKGPNEAFVAWGTSDQTASTSTSISVPPGCVEVFTKETATKIAAICASGETATLRVTVGLDK